MVKVIKRQWEKNNIQKLWELTENPKLFWSHLKSLRGATKSNTSNVIRPQQWVQHFSKLLYSENERKDDQELLLYDDADRNIRDTISTLLVQLTKSLKVNDSISNEMIKESPPFSLFFLGTLFNKILQT